MTPDPARSVGDQPTILPDASVGDQPTILPDASVGDLVTLTGAASTPAATPVLAPPGYVIEKELGRGGMGIVYLARQAGLNRPVALKMILGEGADSKSLIRFLAEAEAVAAIRHPNVVQVYQYGESGGRPFLALEFLSGGSLTGDRRPPGEAASLLAAIADGVQAAHALGIVHRDLKPQNVLLDAAGVPKVTDFGLAKRDTGADLTNTNAIMGTPAYMAPEQAKGETKFVGPEADVWALGVMLYEMLTGAKPFTATNPWLVMKQVTELTPASVRSLSGTVPRDLELICEKCLSKEKAGRYATAGELAADLRRFVAGEPILARPVPGAVKAWKWAKRNRAVAASLAAAVLALVAGAGLAGWQAVLAREAATRERDRADGEATQRQRADDEAAAAKASDREARRLVGRMAVAEGLRLTDAGDGARALAWFVRPREVVPEDAADDLTGDRVAAFRRFARHPVLTEFGGGAVVPMYQMVHGTHAVRISTDTKANVYSARVWDTATGQPVSPPLVHPQRVALAVFSPDGRRLATSDWGRAVRVWDVVTGTPVGPPVGHTDIVSAIALSPDGCRLATVADRSVRVWDALTGTPVAPPVSTAGIASLLAGVTFSPDGRRLAAADLHTIRVWDAATSRPVTPALPHAGTLTAGFSSDGRRLVVANRQSTRVWDLAVERPDPFVLAHKGTTEATAFSPDGRRVVTGFGTGTAQVWDAATGRVVGPPLPHASMVVATAFSPDGRRVATGSVDQTARVWDAATGRPITPPLRHTRGVFEIAFSPDGRRLVTGGTEGAARVWDAETGRAVVPLIRTGGTVTAVAFSPDGGRVVTATAGTARVWDAATGQPAGPPLAHAGAVLAVAFIADGTRVATAGKDNKARVWDAATGQPVGPPVSLTGTVSDAVFSPDGRRLAVVGSDTMRVWDVVAGQPVTPPFGGSGRAVFSPDGRRVATSAADRSVQVWDASSGQPLTPPLPDAGGLRPGAFSPDGRRIVTAGDLKAQARIWELPSDTRPGDDLLRFAHLYAGGRVEPSGAFVPTPDAEVRSTFTELKNKYPADFTVTPAQAMAWQREQLADAERDQDWFAVAFHLRVLLKEYAFADVELMTQLRAAEQKLNPREVLPSPR